MAEEGLPVATKGIQGWVEGLLEAQATTDEIVELSQTTIINAGFVGFSDNPGFTKVLPDNQGEGWDGTFWAVYPYGFDSDPGGNYNYGAFNTMCRVTTPDLITGPATLQTFGYSTKSRRDEIGTSGYRHVLKTTGADILSDSREDVEDPTGDSNTGNAYHKFNFTIPAGVTVNEIEVYGSPNIRASIFGIGANGIGLSDTTSTTILTFASDKDIAQFGAGDTIQQNSEHTPVTSVITQFSADLGPTYSSTLTKSGGWSEPPSNAFDGSSSTAALTSDNNVWTFDASSYNLQLNSSGKVLEIEAGVGGAYSRGNWIINNINTGIEFNGGSRNRDLSRAWCIDNNITTLQSISFVGSGDQITNGLVCIKVNGEQLIDGEDQYTLTFQDDTDLENFRAGDEIDNRGVSPIRYGWFEPDAAYPSVDSNVIAFETATNLDLTSTAEQVLRDSTLVPPGADPTGWQEHLIVDMLNDTTDVLMTADGKNWQVNGSDSLQGPWENLGLINTPNRQSIRALVGSKRYALISYVPMPTSGWKLYNFKIEIQQSWIDAFVNGNNYLFAAGVVSQINTDNNQLILSSAYGTWDANQIAYGPDLGQPNGIVASSDFINNTITLPLPKTEDGQSMLVSMASVSLTFQSKISRRFLMRLLKENILNTEQALAHRKHQVYT